MTPEQLAALAAVRYALDAAQALTPGQPAIGTPDVMWRDEFLNVLQQVARAFGQDGES